MARYRARSGDPMLCRCCGVRFNEYSEPREYDEIIGCYFVYCPICGMDYVVEE